MKKSIFDELKEKAAALLGIKSEPPTPGAPVKNTPVKTAPHSEPYVYVTTGGKKFHYDLLCPGIRNSKELKMGLSKAKKAGYTACDKCCFNYLHK